MAAVQKCIEEAKREAKTVRGLIRAFTLSRAETERLTLVQLQMKYLRANYGIAFPVMDSKPGLEKTGAQDRAALERLGFGQ